ncbi:MAG: GDP-mannose 4,6-dehydratase [Candidatus Ranarchaeia archaeon]
MFEVNPQYWKGKKVLITGISGFVGSYLAEKLIELKSEVHGLVRRHAVPNYPNITHLLDKVNLHQGSLIDLYSLENTIKNSEAEVVFHLGAQSFVPTSIRAPLETYQINIMGTANLLEACRNNNVKRIQFASCYDVKTKAFTKKGLKQYNELEIGDEVLSINPNDETIEYKKIKKIITNDYSGKMYHFKSRSCDLKVTPNHKMLTKKFKGDRIRFFDADKMSGRNLLPLGNFESNIQHIDEDLYYLVGLFIGDGCVVPLNKEVEWSGLTHNEYIRNYRDKQGNFVPIKKDTTKIVNYDRAFLYIPKDDKSRQKVEDTFRKLDIKFSGYDTQIYFNPPAEIYKILKLCGKYAKNKIIPRFLLNSDPKYLRLLFNGLMDSDGSYRKNSYQYTTISSKLVNNVIELCYKLGFSVTVNELKPSKSTISGRIIKSGKAYQIYITTGEKILTKTSEQIETVDYNGLVWCVEVEDYHNLLVERNGKLAFCGNSSETYGLVYPEEAPIKETNPLRPLSPYGVSKAAADLMCYVHAKTYGTPVIRTRAFNHTGPRRGLQFIVSVVTRQVAKAKLGITDTITIGNPEPRRVFTDVRDIVDGYLLTIERGKIGDVYNLGSENDISIGELIEKALDVASLTGKVKVKQDKSRYRKADVMLLSCDSSKARNELGWEPKIPLKQTLEEMIQYYENNPELLDIEAH